MRNSQIDDSSDIWSGLQIRSVLSLGNLIAGVSNYNLDLKKKKALKLHFLLLQLFFYCCCCCCLSLKLWIWNYHLEFPGVSSGRRWCYRRFDVWVLIPILLQGDFSLVWDLSPNLELRWSICWLFVVKLSLEHVQIRAKVGWELCLVLEIFRGIFVEESKPLHRNNVEPCVSSSMGGGLRSSGVVPVEYSSSTSIKQ